MTCGQCDADHAARRERRARVARRVQRRLDRRVTTQYTRLVLGDREGYMAAVRLTKEAFRLASRIGGAL